uniref:Glutaredoxin domain-containing protein n=1 Tax=Araucaria cunninghamii TaxID=56994 RepID=A0A0D6R8K2_ARACU
MVNAKEKAQKIIDENGVVVFSKSYCPYCRSTKQLLDGKKADYFLMELDEVDDGSELQSALAEISGQRTVPNVFISQKHVGGNSDVQALGKKLDAMLKEAGAV